MQTRRRWPWVVAAIVVVILFAVSRIHRSSLPLATTTPSTSASGSCFTAAQSWREIGSTGCVQFTVGYTYVSSAGNAYLDQYQNYTSGFGVWIPAGSSFGATAASEYANKTIKVTGTISSYDGAPQIEVRDQSQIALAG